MRFSNNLFFLPKFLSNIFCSPAWYVLARCQFIHCNLNIQFQILTIWSLSQLDCYSILIFFTEMMTSIPKLFWFHNWNQIYKTIVYFLRIIFYTFKNCDSLSCIGFKVQLFEGAIVWNWIDSVGIGRTALTPQQCFLIYAMNSVALHKE